MAHQPPSCLLFLDLATRCGWALWLNGRRYYGVWNFRPREQADGERFRKLWKHLHRIEDQCAKAGARIAEVHFEDVLHLTSRENAQAFGGYRAIVQLWALTRPEPMACIPWPVQTLKIHATGKGNADKTAMIAAARKRGWRPQDDNAADALWGLDAALTWGRPSRCRMDRRELMAAKTGKGATKMRAKAKAKARWL